MTVSPSRPATGTPAIPRPRAAEPELPPAKHPWPEPWRSDRALRPRSEYWDVATATWQSRGTSSPPRPAD